MEKKIVIYAGSFDPITNGHLNIIEQASKMFDKVIVGVLVNSAKNPLFTIEERVMLIEKVIETNALKDNVEVKSFRGSLVDFAELENAAAIIKGLRSISDFEIELQLALINRSMSNGKFNTIFFIPDIQYQYISSSMVKEIALLHKDVSNYVPFCVEQQLKAKMGN